MALALTPGCLLLSSAEPVQPQGPVVPWTQGEGDPLVARYYSCGFCGNGSKVALLIVYDTGHVLLAHFEYTTEMDYSSADGLERYEPALRRADEVNANRVDQHGFRLIGAATGRLTGQEWTEVRAVLDDAIESVEDPGPADFDCVDCAGISVQLFQRPAMDVVLSHSDHPDFGNFEWDDPWGRIVRQTHFILEWVEPGLQTG